MNIEELYPNFVNIDCAIAVSCSNEYVPYLSVYLLSLKKFANSSKYYDLIVFERDITAENKSALKNLFNSNNLSIRFFNPSSYFSGYNLYISHDYFKEECYFRLVAPLVLKHFKKIIFTDIDLILNDDISLLFEIDLHDNIIAAAIEPVWRELYDRNCKIYNTNIRDYTKTVLNLTDPYIYFNTGVCIFDVEKYNNNDSFARIMKAVNSTHFLYQEQCALNYFFKNKIYTLQPEWNFELAPSIVNNSNNLWYYNDYRKFESNAKIIHYLGRYKPWKNVFEYKANLWWSYAFVSPFFSYILQNLIVFQSSLRVNSLRGGVNLDYINYQNKLFFVLNHSFYYHFTKFRYKVKKAFLFGEKYQKYDQKYKRIKKLLKDAKFLKLSLEKI